MQKVKELYEKKGTIWGQMQDVARRLREAKTADEQVLNADESRQFDLWDKEYNNIDSQIRVLERTAHLEAEQTVKEGEVQERGKDNKYQFGTTIEQRSTVNKKVKDGGYNTLTEEERGIYYTVQKDAGVFNKWLRQGYDNLDQEERKILAERREVRAQSIGTPSAGGYTVPEGFSGYIIEKMKFISELLNWAQILETETGNSIPFPINDDTSNTGELIGENADISSSSADLVFSVYTLSAYKYSSKMIKVSNELLQDNGVNLVEYLGRMLANRFARITNTHFTTGTGGGSQPQGYVTGASQGLVTASATAFTSTEVIRFLDSIDRAYQNAPKFALAMHQNVLSAIKQLTIGTNYNSQLWVPSFREGAPDRIQGKPYFVNNAMASALTTGQKIIVAGDWDKYLIRRVNSFTLRRLTERYAEFDQVAFFGLGRMDGFVQDNTALKYLELT